MNSAYSIGKGVEAVTA